MQSSFLEKETRSQGRSKSTPKRQSGGGGPAPPRLQVYRRCGSVDGKIQIRALDIQICTLLV